MTRRISLVPPIDRISQRIEPVVLIRFHRLDVHVAHRIGHGEADASFRAEQEKRRREEALANATGIRVLQSIVAAIPVRLMKRDLVFIAGQLLLLRNRSIKAKEGESVGKLLTALIRKSDEGAVGKLIIEAVILLCHDTVRRRQSSPRSGPDIWC